MFITSNQEWQNQDSRHMYIHRFTFTFTFTSLHFFWAQMHRMWVCGHKAELRLRQQGFCSKNLLYKSVKPVVTNLPFLPWTAVTKSFLLLFNNISRYSFLMFHKGKDRYQFRALPTTSLALEGKRGEKNKNCLFFNSVSLLTSSKIGFVLNKDIIYIQISSQHRVPTKLSVFQIFQIRIL